MHLKRQTDQEDGEFDEVVQVDVSENSVDSEYPNPDAHQLMSFQMLCSTRIYHLQKVVMKICTRLMKTQEEGE